MKNLDLDSLGLLQLSSLESTSIDGGDIDGLMRGSQSNDGFVYLAQGVTTVAGAVVGFIHGFFS